MHKQRYAGVILNREKVMVIVGRVIDTLGSLVFLKLLTSWATKNDVGMYLLASSLLAAILTISFSALDQGLFRNIASYYRRGELPSRLSATMVVYLGMSFVFCAVGIGYVSIGVSRSFHEIVMPLCIWLTFEPIKNLNQVVASGMRSRTLLASASVIDYCARISILFFCYKGGALDSFSIIALMALASLVQVLVYLIGHRSLITLPSLGVARETLSDAFKFSWPMILWGAFGWLQNMSGRWLLGNYSDVGVVAEYGVIISIATFPVMAILGVVVAYFQPILYEVDNECNGRSFEVVKRITFFVAPVFVVVTLIFAILHERIISLLTSVDYVKHSVLLPAVVAAASFSAISSILTYAIYSQRRVKSLIFSNTVPGLFSLVLGYFLIRRSQLEGAVAAYVMTNVMVGIMFIGAYLKNRDAS